MKEQRSHWSHFGYVVNTLEGEPGGQAVIECEEFM